MIIYKTGDNRRLYCNTFVKLNTIISRMNISKLFVDLMKTSEFLPMERLILIPLCNGHEIFFVPKKYKDLILTKNIHK